MHLYQRQKTKLDINFSRHELANMIAMPTDISANLQSYIAKGKTATHNFIKRGHISNPKCNSQSPHFKNQTNL